MPTLTLSISLRLLTIHSVCSSVPRDSQEGKMVATETKLTRPNASTQVSIFRFVTTFLNQQCEQHNAALQQPGDNCSLLSSRYLILFARSSCPSWLKIRCVTRPVSFFTKVTSTSTSFRKNFVSDSGYNSAFDCDVGRFNSVIKLPASVLMVRTYSEENSN
jgi:hypothetical protein